MQKYSRKILLLLLLLTGAMLLAGLWPLRFSPPNRVRVEPGVGLSFSGPGIVYVPASFRWPSLSDGSRTVEIWVRAQQETLRQVSYIVCTMHNDAEDLLIGQWGSGLVVRRHGRDQQGNWRISELGVRGGLPRGKWQYVAITSGADGTNIYVDGVLQASAQNQILRGEIGDRILLGNASTGHEEWRGDLGGLVFYSRVLHAAEIQNRWRSWAGSTEIPEPVTAVSGCYRFNKGSAEWARDATGNNPGFYLPTVFHPLRRTMLAWDMRWNRSGLKDVVVNILGFIPFGFLLTACLVRARPRQTLPVVLEAVAGGMMLSLVIEVIQSFIPVRSSSSTDLLMNTTGTLLGSALLLYLRSKVPTLYAVFTCCGASFALK